MRLADHLTLTATPFIVRNERSGALTYLNGAADFAAAVRRCPTRYVLSDELTRLCTALAYSKGARTLACADLLHAPAQSVWIEWCEAPWRTEMARYGLASNPGDVGRSDHRGAFICASRDGRRGLLRTFWTHGEAAKDVMASSMEAYFDLDAPEWEAPEPPDGVHRPAYAVSDGHDAEVLRRFFRFRFERSWAEYYDRAPCTPGARAAIARHALGTIAADVPVLLAFMLLLGTRWSLPQQPRTFERLNRSRAKSGKAPLLDHIEVRAPVLPECRWLDHEQSTHFRRAPRMHHVRGHLVRRGNRLFWRVPHLRGSARAGAVRSRTVVWELARVDSAAAGEPVS